MLRETTLAHSQIKAGPMTCLSTTSAVGICKHIPLPLSTTWAGSLQYRYVITVCGNLYPPPPKFSIQYEVKTGMSRPRYYISITIVQSYNITGLLPWCCCKCAVYVTMPKAINVILLPLVCMMFFKLLIFVSF